ncbi:hypothetical protein HMPREF1631_02225 [Arcanobacterium sp. S3PF19]|nr:hypothetical protein HMPREF1631_02225 [Arcanobacterium sp. S3PF19]
MRRNAGGQTISVSGARDARGRRRGEIRAQTDVKMQTGGKRGTADTANICRAPLRFARVSPR